MSNIKGVVAAGHENTVSVAEEILNAGGNAFDAIIAAHFAACVAEPVLASLAGGGYLLAHKAGEKPMVYDFFVQTPQKKRHVADIEFKPIHANFGRVTQEFHIGAASIATPGTVKGIFAVHTDLCSMSMSDLVAPAIAFAKNGVVINPFQAYIFDIIHPILTSTQEAAELYRSQLAAKEIISSGKKLVMTELAGVLDALAREGEKLFYEGEIAQSIHDLSREHAGHIEKIDLADYRVAKRKPLDFRYGDRRIVTNPPPSSGGLLIAFALKLLKKTGIHQFPFGSYEHLHLVIETMAQTNKARLDFQAEKYQSENTFAMLDPEFLALYYDKVHRRAQSMRGTTHLSVLDNFGNSASMTVSNGEGCGYLIPNTGVMLNNMLGEEDLNPAGFHLWQHNQRMTSMMAPTMLLDKQGDAVVLGSGGSNRIRTAILQVLLNLLEYDKPLCDAIKAPRVHFEAGILNMEQGFPAHVINKLCDEYKQHKLWNDINLFFGGVHAVERQGSKFFGVGDPRRGGVEKIVY